MVNLKIGLVKVKSNREASSVGPQSVSLLVNFINDNTSMDLKFKLVKVKSNRETPSVGPQFFSQLVNFNNENISMDLKLGLVKVKSNRETSSVGPQSCSLLVKLGMVKFKPNREASSVGSQSVSPPESPSLTISKVMFIEGNAEAKTWPMSQGAVYQLVMPSTLKIDQNLMMQNPTTEDLIHLDLGDSDGIRKVWKPGLGKNKTTIKHTNEADKTPGKRLSWTQRTPKAVDKQRWIRTSFGPEYSSDNAGDGPVGKTVRKKNQEKASRMQNKENWHTMEVERRAGLPKVPVREVDELTRFIELMAGCRREEISPVIWEYVRGRTEPARVMVNGLSSNLISGVLSILTVMGHALKMLLSTVAEQTKTERGEMKAAVVEPTEELVEENEAETIETVEEDEAEPTEAEVEENEAEPTEAGVQESEAEPTEAVVEENEAEPTEAVVE